MANIKELISQIKPMFDKVALEKMDLAEQEMNNYLNFKLFPVDILVKADWNYKEENETTSDKLHNNMKRIGQVENIQVRELPTGYYEVVNGNHRLDQVMKLERKLVVAYDHGVISLTEAQRIALETNETKFMADSDKLNSLLQGLSIEFDLDDLKMTMPFDDSTLDGLYFDEVNMNSQMIDYDGEEGNNIGTTEDDVIVEEVPEPKTKRGDIYEFNGHRLMCGDSTSATDVKTLMDGKIAHMLHTDPPYNISYPEFNAKRGDSSRDWSSEYCPDWSDEMSDSDYKKFLFNFLKNAKDNLIETGHYYVWHATTYFRELLDAFEAVGIPYDKVPIQWVKQVAPLSWVRYKRKSEPCIYGGKGAVNGAGHDARWFGPNNETNIWEINRDATQTYIHPTQKPIALAGRAIKNSSQEGELVLELFGGSGSTLMASEQLGRKCHVMELSPGFCDGIMKRYIKYCTENNINIDLKLNGQDVSINYFE